MGRFPPSNLGRSPCFSQRRPLPAHVMPDYEAFMLPLLRELASNSDSVEAVARKIAVPLGLSDQDQAARLPWAHEPLVVARTRMAAESLAAARLIRRGDRLALEERGRTFLSENPDKIDRETLRRFPEFETYLQAHLARQGA